MDEKYEIVSCDVYGNNVSSHPNAVQTEAVHDELNAAGSFKFSVPSSDPFLTNLHPLIREVQVWRAGASAPLFWGPITGRDYDKSTGRWQISCQGVLWYLSRRVFGRAGRRNWLTNGSFDTGDLTGWTPHVTANIVTQWGARPGAYQLNLYQDHANVDSHVAQAITVPGGQLYTVSAWFHIRTDSTWVGPALDGRGLYVDRLNPANGALEDVQFFAITDSTIRGQFQRATVTIDTPPGRDSILDIRVYATGAANPTPVPPRPPGSIIWDDVSVTQMESTSFSNSDVATIVNGITAHAQDVNYLKNDLNITGAALTTGVLLDRSYQHVDHRQCLDAIMEFTQLNYCDVGVYFVGGTQRVIACYGPQKGTLRSDRVLELDATYAIREVQQLQEDGTKVVTSAIVEGDGSGPERDEGGWWDASTTNGMVFEEVFQAEPGPNYDLLQGIAQAKVARLNKVPRIPQVKVDGAYIGDLTIGDTVPMVISSLGTESIDANYRIVATDVDTTTDTMVLTLNPA